MILKHVTHPGLINEEIDYFEENNPNKINPDIGCLMPLIPTFIMGFILILILLKSCE